MSAEPKALTPAQRELRFKSAATLHDAAAIIVGYTKDQDLAQKLIDLADEIAPNQGE
jgi:hypothetical protein